MRTIQSIAGISSALQKAAQTTTPLWYLHATIRGERTRKLLYGKLFSSWFALPIRSRQLLMLEMEHSRQPESC